MPHLGIVASNLVCNVGRKCSARQSAADVILHPADLALTPRTQIYRLRVPSRSRQSICRVPPDLTS